MYLSCRNTLEVHLGHGKRQRSFASQPSFQSGRIEGDITAYLGNVELQFAESCLQELVFIAGGVPPGVAPFAPMVLLLKPGIILFSLPLEQNGHGIAQVVKSMLDYLFHCLCYCGIIDPVDDHELLSVLVCGEPR